MDTATSYHCTPRFRLLDESQILKIHHAALRILQEVGVRVLHEEAVDLLAGHGAGVKDGNLVRIPSFLVEEAIQSAPSSFLVYNRKKEPVMDLGARRIYFGTGTDLPKTVDLGTREIRDTKAQDIVVSALISDAMPNIDFIGSYGLPKDITPGLHYIKCFQLELENSVKPIFFTAGSEEDLRIILEMASTVAGGPSESALNGRSRIWQPRLPVSPVPKSHQNRHEYGT